MDYLLKASAIIALFYFAYAWFLQWETFFNSNRWFLLIGQITALLLPLIVIPIYVEVSTQTFNPLVISNMSTNEQIVAESVTIEAIIYWIYGLGVLFFFGKFMVHFLSLVKLIKGKSSKKIDGIQYIETEDTLAPFSFFNWVVYNPNTFKNDELQLILNHERVHVKQWHSIDVIFTQLSCIVFWFNPLVWYYKKALQQNLEFIADNHTQSETDCKQSYQRLLLKASVPTHQLVMANNFYNSLIKKRIVMLHTSKSNTLKSWKYALVIPALALFLMSFNTKTVYVTETVSQNETTNKTFTVSASTTHLELQEIERYFSDKVAKIKFTAISRNSDNTIKEITIRTNHDGGTKFTKRMTVGLDNSDTIEPFSIGLSDDEKNILLQFSKDETTLISKDVISFRKEATVGTSRNAKEIINKSDGLGENPLYSINGKQLRKTDLNQKNYKISGSIEVINKKEAKEIYGEAGKDGVIIFNGKTTFETKAQEKNLIAVITKDFSDSELKATQARFKDEDVSITFDKLSRNSENELTGITINYESKVSQGNHFINGDKPINAIQLNLNLDDNNLMVSNMSPLPEDENLLILLNDKEITKADMNALNPSTIESTHVITDKKKLQKHDTKGKDGVIIITTKKQK